MRTFRNYLITIIYGITAIALLIVCLETDISPTVEIAFGDSYTAFAQKHVLLVLTVLFFIFTLISLVQELSRRPLIRFLSWTHYVLTMISLVSLRYILLVAVAPNKDIDYSLPENIDEAAQQNADWKTPLLAVCIILLAAQAIFLLNVIITQFKRRRKAAPETPAPEQETVTTVED